MGVQTKPLPQHGAQTVDAWEVPLERRSIPGCAPEGLDMVVKTPWQEVKLPPFDPLRCLAWAGVVLIGLMFWACVSLALFRFVL